MREQAHGGDGREAGCAGLGRGGPAVRVERWLLGWARHSLVEAGMVAAYTPRRPGADRALLRALSV